jgi:hypothetical protein
MMKVCLAFASVVLASSAVSAQQAEPAPGAPRTTHGVASAVRFATTAELPAPGGQVKTYRLSLGDIKASGRKSVQFPPSGFYVATLVTNDVISIEGDQRVPRHTGDSWAVPAGQALVLEPQGKNHTVLIEVFRVEPIPAR